MTLQGSYLLGYERRNARRCPLAKNNLGLSDDSGRAHCTFVEPLRYLGAEPFRYFLLAALSLNKLLMCVYVEG
jgi:hypothetical protein